MRMKNKFLLFLMLGITLFAACNDDDEPDVIPTVADVIGTYSGDSLQATVDDAVVGETASVQILQNSDNSTSLLLVNVVPGYSSLEIPNVTYEAVSRSSYYSQLSGQYSDNIMGLNVQASATVDESVMTLTVTTSDIAGAPVNAEYFYDKTFRGEMGISLMGTSVTMDQRVYLLAPTSGEATDIRLRIENFSFGDLSLGNIELDSVQFVQRGDVYGFTVKDKKMDLPALSALHVTDVTLDARGAILENKTLRLILAVDAPPFLVDVTFEGDTVQESSNTLATLAVEGDAVLVQPTATESDPRTFVMQVNGLATAEDLTLTPEVTLPTGAVLDSIVVCYNDGTILKTTENDAIDFSQVTGDNGYVKYYVTGEDVREHGVTTLKVETLPVFRDSYTMTEWVSSGNYKEPQYLASSNPAADYLPLGGMFSTPRLSLSKEPYFVSQDGESAKIISRNTEGAHTGDIIIPKVTAGTLFNGSFVLNITNTLASTQFGEVFAKTTAPRSFTFTYKYIPGPTFYNTIVERDGENHVTNVTSEIVDNKTDQCSCIAYLYEVEDYSEYLDGTNINTSEKVIMKAAFLGGQQDSFVTQTVNFEETGNGTFDPSKKYKMAVVFTPSYEGDQYAGAPESTLWIKSFEVTY